MSQSAHLPGTPQTDRLRSFFVAAFGCFLGLALLKFGNPPIMEKFVTAPGNLMEFVIWSPWPIAWAYALLCLLALLGLLAAARRIEAPAWILLLPMAWVGWQLLATTQSIDPGLSYPTVVHFLACCGCFYLGYFSVRTPGISSWLWPGITIGFLLVLAVGFQQHFGGLEQTRHYFETLYGPTLNEVPPDLLKKMSSARIFSTLFYPNALAGAILLFTPPVLSLISGARRRFTLGARIFLLSVVGVAAVACLVWSGSKGGWLLLLFLSFLALLRLSFSRRIKLIAVGVVLACGLAAFGFKYAGFFRKGATSVAARFDYWQAALRTALANPVFGTGPGTFAKPYQQLKKPESEMARLVHNDYLEQASDSGWVGFLVFTAFIAAALTYAYPCSFHGQEGRLPNVSAVDHRAANWHLFAVWLGILGWALQSLFEFGLYIPALAWPAFALVGSLLATRADA